MGENEECGEGEQNRCVDWNGESVRGGEKQRREKRRKRVGEKWWGEERKKKVGEVRIEGRSGGKEEERKSSGGIWK